MVHADHYIAGTFAGAGIGWGSMKINNDCYVTITVHHGSRSMITLNLNIKYSLSPSVNGTNFYQRVSSST